MIKMRIVIALLATSWLATLSTIRAEEGAEAAQANNPLANMTALNFQNYYIGELTGSDDSANQFWVRYAKPFSIGKQNWLLRASLPVYSYPVGASGDTETGLSDLNLFAAIESSIKNMNHVKHA